METARPRDAAPVRFPSTPTPRRTRARSPWIRSGLLAIAMVLAGGILFQAWAAAKTDTAPPKSSTPASPGVQLAQTVTAITGIAISPLLGVSAIGAWQHFKAPREERPHMAFYTQPWFWLMGFLIVGLVAAKDSFGTVIPPGLKKPFDVAEIFENKLSGLVAAGALIPMVSSFLGAFTHQESSSLADAGLAAIGFPEVQSILVLPFALFVYAVVWLASHAINILILLSPWGVVDAVLKGARTALLAGLALVSTLSPTLGAILSAVLILVAYLTAGWAFRLLVFGWIFGWDFVLRRRRRFTPSTTANPCFTARPLEGVPIRTYGKLQRASDGTLVVRYKPWLVLPERSLALPTDHLAIGNAFLNPTLVQTQGDGTVTLLSFPPRCRTHEEELARAYGIPVVDVGLLGGLKAIGACLRELFGLQPAHATR